MEKITLLENEVGEQSESVKKTLNEINEGMENVSK